MHQQIRTRPAKSPDNLEELLAVLADAGINIEAAGGSDVELGGEFGFAVAHDRTDEAMQLLEGAGYRPRLVDVHECLLDDVPGQLLACISEARAANAERGGAIRDIAIGVPDEQGRLRVQVYSELPSSSSSA